MPPPDDRPPDPQAAWQKAATIGAPGIGSRYLTPLNPTTWDLIKAFLGGERPQTVAAQDPYGIQAWEAGKGPPPMLFGTTEPVKAPGIRAYHGSPHEFEKFSLSKIGTGEGAQAYGHGLYFAEKEATARAYREGLSGYVPDIEYAGQRIDPKSPRHAALQRMPTTGKEAEVDMARRWLKTLEESQARPTEIADQQRHIAWLERVDPAKVKVQDPGKMYEVNIGAHFDDFLDWDKPLSEQHPKVREALLEAMKKRGLPLDEAGVPLWAKSDPSGESMHAALSAVGQSNREGQALGANLLKESGIPGIKYLDQGSRAAGEGTRNYVVFDDKLLTILRKYGLLPPVAAGTLGLSQLARPAQPEGR